MDTFDCIQTRRSIRKFLDKQVEWDNVVKIIEAGRMAPNAGNVQNYKIIIVKDEAKRKQIAEAALQQYWIAQAPVILVILDEPEKISRHYGDRGKDVYSFQHCGALIENMLLAANALGLSSCWVGAFEEDMLRRALDVKSTVRPQAILPIGYPDETVPTPPRMPIQAMVFIERYGNNIANRDIATGWWGGVWRKGIEEGKKEAEKKAGKLHKKVLEAGKQLHEKIKKKLQKQ